MSAPAGTGDPIPSAGAVLPGPDVLRTLQLVADTIVESLGFEICAINVVVDDDTLVVGAVSGPQDACDFLLHSRQGRAGWARLVAASASWGRLRFLDHNDYVEEPADMLTWIPDIPVLDHAEAWHPEDALFAPLTATDGQHLGVLSVDVPRDGLRPGPATRHALEAFVVTASLTLEHARLASESRRSSRRFQAVFDSSPIAVALLGPDRCFSSVNPAMCRFLGRGSDELVGHDPFEFTHPDDLRAATAQVGLLRGDAAPASAPAPVDKRYLHPSGAVVWGRLHLALLGGDDPGTIIAQVEDITERKRAEELLVRQAHFDLLTGLPNRAHSMHRLAQALEPAEQDLTVVFFCDVDHLKRVNDTHGHAVGDAYLRHVSDRIRQTVRAHDVVGRLSGDEFVVVLHAVDSRAEAVGLAERVLAAVQAPLRVEGIDLLPSLSLGIASGSGSDATPDELLARADAAMYRAKAARRGSMAEYDLELDGPVGQVGSGEESTG